MLALRLDMTTEKVEVRTKNHDASGKLGMEWVNDHARLSWKEGDCNHG
jgi:hypothetical protein